MTPRESGQTSIWSFITRELGKPSQEAKQMKAKTDLACAASHAEVNWPAIDWRKVTQTVRRLQARIVKATREGRWGKVKALQHNIC
jgi:RNA-directed DNA polymerase